MRYLFWIYAVFHVCCPFVEFPIKKNKPIKNVTNSVKKTNCKNCDGHWTNTRLNILMLWFCILPRLVSFSLAMLSFFDIFVIAYRYFFEIKTIFHFTLGIPRASLCSHPYEFKVFYVCVFIYLFIYFFIQMLVLILKKYYGAYFVYLTFFYVL